MEIIQRLVWVHKFLYRYCPKLYTKTPCVWYLYRAAEVVKQHPNVMVMLDHCGLPYETDEVNLKQWKQGKIFYAAVCIL